MRQRVIDTAQAALRQLQDLRLDQRIDQLVGLFSPEAEVRRVRSRLASRQLRRIEKRTGYEGATSGRRTEGWIAASSSADSAATGLATLRARSRDLVRNNPYARGGLDVIEANTVGAGIIPQAKTGEKRRVQKFEALLRAWADEPVCDVTGTYDFYGLQAQVVRALAQDGGCLVRRVTQKIGPGLPPLQLQLLELDYLDTAKDGRATNGNRVIQGIEIDGYGRKVAYYLFKEHPGQAGYLVTRRDSVRVDARDCLMVYRADRPGQVLGVPWLAPALLRLRDLDDYEDAQLVRQKIAACFTAFVTDTEGLETTDSDDSTVEAYSRFEPGAIEFLTPGKNVTFADPPAAEGYGEHTKAVLRSIAKALGITYESLTGDLSNVNFSSGRMGWLEMHRNITKWQQQILIPQFCRPAFRWFVEAADVAGLASGAVWSTWTPPRREMIDPVSETKATISQIRAGLKPWSDAVKEGGRDPEEVRDQMAEDMAMFDEKGLVLDCDPRVDQAAKTAAPAEAPEEEDVA